MPTSVPRVARVKASVPYNVGGNILPGLEEDGAKFKSRLGDSWGVEQAAFLLEYDHRQMI